MAFSLNYMYLLSLYDLPLPLCNSGQGRQIVRIEGVLFMRRREGFERIREANCVRSASVHVCVYVCM